LKLEYQIEVYSGEDEHTFMAGNGRQVVGLMKTIAYTSTSLKTGDIGGETLRLYTRCPDCQKVVHSTGARPNQYYCGKCDHIITIDW